MIEYVHRVDVTFTLGVIVGDINIAGLAQSVRGPEWSRVVPVVELLRCQKSPQVRILELH